MNNLLSNYNKIYQILSTIVPKVNFLNQKRTPTLSDLEPIALNLTAEYMSIDSEHQLFRMLPTEFTSKIDRTNYNRRKRRLFPFIDQVREKLSQAFHEFEDHYIIDSMPIAVVKPVRANRSKICKEDFRTAPTMGYCASQSMYYYGYKLHGVCSVRGVFKSVDMTPASVHDIQYLNDVKYHLRNVILVGDKGYISEQYKENLFETRNIRLEVPMRTNQADYKEQGYVFRRCRKRIETLFSQLCDQFILTRNYAKTFEGLKVRVLSKITALTMIQYINHFIDHRKLNAIKINIV